MPSQEEQAKVVADGSEDGTSGKIGLAYREDEETAHKPRQLSPDRTPIAFPS
jgi:hypothetical protein